MFEICQRITVVPLDATGDDLCKKNVKNSIQRGKKMLQKLGVGFVCLHHPNKRHSHKIQTAKKSKQTAQTHSTNTFGGNN